LKNRRYAAREATVIACAIYGRTRDLLDAPLPRGGAAAAARRHTLRRVRQQLSEFEAKGVRHADFSAGRSYVALPQISPAGTMRM
jgi:hypothetical protein